MNAVEKQVFPACLLAHPEQGCTEGVLMMNYLPKDASVAQACTWLQNKTGEAWDLSRLIECGLTPYFWLDYSPEHPALFGDRVEGCEARMMFQGDIRRLQFVGADALVTMFIRTHDGQKIMTKPGIPVPLAELRFKREDVVSLTATPAPAEGTSKKWTPEKLAELKAYRAANTMEATAAKFGISQQRIRELLPSGKPQKKPYSVFTHRIK